MRILHLVHQYLPDHIGGTELYTHWLTQALSRRGHEISIFYRRSAAGSGLDHRLEGSRQIWTGWNGLLSPTRRFLATLGNDSTLVKAFKHVLEEAQPEIVHIEHLMGHPPALIQAIQDHDIPYVITLWDFWWVCANAQLLTNYDQKICSGPQLYLNCARCVLARADRSQLWPTLPAIAGALLWRNLRLRKIMNRAGRLIAPTEFVYNWYIIQGAPADRLIRIQPGLELNSPTVVRRAVETNRPIRFGYIGGLASQKGVHILLAAFNRLEGKAELWIGGDESANPAYTAHLRSQSSTTVRFLGKLSREEVWQILGQIDVLVVPSMWYETFAFVISEAFAAGVPVIASRLGPLADRVHHEVDGLLVPPGDAEALHQALRRLQDEPALLSQLQTGIGPVRTMADHVRDIESVYRAVLTG